MKQTKQIIALGFFDGVHLGHGALLEAAKAGAASLGAEPAVLTFDRHPDTTVRGEKVELISSPSDRVLVLNHYYGIKNVYFLHFNRETMAMPWGDFLESAAKSYGAAGFVAGHDFRFGYQGEGDAAILQDWCRKRDLFCRIIEPVTLDGQVVSSTLIRGMIAQGDMAQARRFLGHPWLLSGTVRSGFHIGRTISAPTINILPSENLLIPRHGVYATRVFLDGEELPAVTNVGLRPTFGGDHITIETNILDFQGDLYNRTVSVAFYAFIRPERRFDSPEALASQIRLDAERARELLCRKDSCLPPPPAF